MSDRNVETKRERQTNWMGHRVFKSDLREGRLDGSKSRRPKVLASEARHMDGHTVKLLKEIIYKEGIVRVMYVY
jgi:hypothetical protein